MRPFPSSVQRERVRGPRRGGTLLGAAVLGALFAAACRSGDPEPVADEPSEVEAPVPAPPRTPVQAIEVVDRYPHDPRAYTQGLLVVDGELYESTGQRGESTVRRVDLEKGTVDRARPLARQLFGEGLASTGGLLVQLTWTSRKALVWDRASLRQLDYSYPYDGEGWGLTTRDDGRFVMSDGTSRLRIVDPKGFKVVGTLDVTDQGRPVIDLNELEWIEGEIWANVWKSDRIARIDPATGEVRAWVDCSGLLPPGSGLDPTDEVLNGIAYDAAKGAIYVTGKRWPTLFEIRVVE
ncbi:MAG: glutaminyl-peptide cyclotransferase [Planctomycetota bacterium]